MSERVILKHGQVWKATDPDEGPLTLKVYKLTNREGKTYGGTQWQAGTRHEAAGESKALCSDGWIHAYESRYIAALLNPSHANFERPQLWEADGEGEPLRDGQLKLGFKALTTLRRIPLPRFSLRQRVAFAIFCALEVYEDAAFAAWAEGWLSGKDRSVARAAELVTWAARAWAAEAARAARARARAAAAAAAEAAAAEAADINLDALARKAYAWRDPLKAPSTRC